MWYLKTSSRTFYVRYDKSEFIIGRSAGVCDLVLTGDPSVSRRHALLRYENNQLLLQDLGTKYGTFFNEDIEKKTSIGNEACISLKDNDRIRFGTLENVWTVHKISLITCTSTMKGENLEDMKIDLDVLGVKLQSEWDDSCTHLTMPSITLTAKVLAALAFERHIVTAQFWKAWRKVVMDGGTPPNPLDYLPEVIENTLNKENVSCAPNSARKSLFIGKKFIFFSRKQMNFYKIILEKCGATVGLLSESKLTKSKLCAEDIVVIQFSGSVSGQESQSQKHIIGDIVNYMNGKSRRIIPDIEIGLAVLLMSTEKYCNPKRSILAMFNQPDVQNKNENILALETQDSNLNKKDETGIEIEESLVSMNNDITLNSSLRTDTKESERCKRKFHDDNSSDHISKKPNMNESLVHSRSMEEDIFDFVREAPQISISSVSSRSPGKKLDFFKPKNKRNINTEDNIFNFLSDSKNKELPSSKQNFPQSSLFNISGNKRKLQNMEETIPKKPYTEILKSSDKFEVIADFKELLKHSFWKSCAEEIAKQEIKHEPEELHESKLDCGEAVVSICQDLIVKMENSVSSSDSLHSGPNFKKFKKVFPLKMQVVVIPSSSMSIYRAEPPSDMEMHVESSDDDESIWFKNVRGNKRMVR